MTVKHEIAKWAAGVILLFATACLFFSIAYGIWDSTRARATNERVAEQRAQAATRRIDSQQLQIQSLQEKLVTSEYQRGLIEGQTRSN